MVPHFNPPYDLEQILNPTSPPASPSFSESAHSTSSCPSPAPSVSPGPPPRLHVSQPAHLDISHSTGDVHEGSLVMQVADTKATTPAGNFPSTVASRPPAPGQVQLPLPDQKFGPVHYLKVRNKDGTHKILCLDHKTYLKVMTKIKDSAGQPGKQGQGIQIPTSTTPTDSHPKQMPVIKSQMEAQLHADSSVALAQPSLIQQVDVQQDEPKLGQKLDTFDDLIRVLESNVKAAGTGFELRQVSPDSVQIKEEPMDADYESQTLVQTNRMPDIKQEATLPDSSSGPWTSTGQHIRAGTDTITNADEPCSTSAKIKNIIKYLERDDAVLPNRVSSSTVKATGEQTAARPSSVRHVRPAGQMTTAASKPAQGKGVTYVMGSAPVASLSQVSVGGSQEVQRLQQSTRKDSPPQSMVRMQNANSSLGQATAITSVSGVKNTRLVRSPCDTLGQTVSTSAVHGGQSKGTSHHTSAAPVLQAVGTVTQGMNILLIGEQVPPLNTTAVDIQVQPASTASFPAVSSQSVTQQMSSQAQLFAGPSPPSSQVLVTSTIDTSALAPIQVPAASSGNLMSESTSQIMQYLTENSIESLGNWYLTVDCWTEVVVK